MYVKTDSLTMEMNLLYIVFTTILASLLLESGSDAARIDINPPRCIATLEKSVQISCVPDSPGDEENDITFMELSRNDEDPIVFLRGCSNVTYGKGRSSQFKAEGHIDKNPRNSYLNVTLLNPTSQDTGIYTCLVLYVDNSGHPQQETSTSDLMVEKLDVKSLETALILLKETMATMEKKHGKHMDDLQEVMNHMTDLEMKTTQQMNGVYDRVMKNTTALVEEATHQMYGVSDTVMKNLTALEEKTAQQMNGILSDRVSYMVAFSATATKKSNNDFIRPNVGEVLVLSQVIMRVGQGYDESTGKFTAPRNGIYAFHLVVTDGTSCELDMDLKVNDAVIARSYASATNAWEQASFSSVTNLKAGDKVFSVFKKKGCVIRDDKYTVFTGYLLKAL